MKLIGRLIALLLLPACVTSNIRISADICKEGNLVGYEDEDFRMNCQKTTKYIYKGQVPRSIVHEQPDRNGPSSLDGLGPYGRKIISVVKRR